MFSIFFVGLFLFLCVLLILKVLFFIIGVLLAGAGFFIRTVVTLIILFPVFPLILLVLPFISILPIILIFLSGIVISSLISNDKKYNKNFN